MNNKYNYNHLNPNMSSLSTNKSLHPNYTYPVITPFGENNNNTTEMIETKEKPVKDRDTTPVYYGIWHWFQENCYVPFISSFHQQFLNDVIHTGLNILPIFNLFHRFNQNTWKVCQDMSRSEHEKITMEIEKRKKNADAGGWRKIFSIQGLFVLSLLAAICLVAITEDRSSSTRPPSLQNKKNVPRYTFQPDTKSKHNKKSNTNTNGQNNNNFHLSMNNETDTISFKNNVTSPNPLNGTYYPNKYGGDMKEK